MAYTHVLFDADDTLFDFQAACRHSLTETVMQLTGQKLSNAFEVYERNNRRWWKAFELGQDTIDELTIGRFNDFVAEMQLADYGTPEQWKDEYQKNLGACAILVDGAAELCDELYGKCRMYIVTNGIAAQAANVNTATLTYSNDPTNDATVGTTSSTANVYSYQFVFSKYAEDTNGVFKNVRLVGAEFQLYKVEGATKTLVNFTTQTATNDEGTDFTKYIVAEQAIPGTTTDTLKVHETGDETITLNHLNFGGHRGDVFIFGLSEGTYELVETKAPDGYILPDAPFSIEIVDAIGELGSVGTLSVTSSHTGSGSIVNTNGMGELILTVWADITNAPGSALPETGGMGTTIFTVLGIILMAGAVAFFTSRKRSRVQ